MVQRAPVQLLDLMPTLTDLTGNLQLNGVYADSTVNLGMSMAQGVSLRPLLTQFDTYVRGYAMSQYVRYGSGSQEVMGYAFRTIRYRYVRWVVWRTFPALAEGTWILPAYFLLFVFNPPASD